MIDENAESLMRPSSSLRQLIADAHRTPDARIGEFTRLASAVQRMRHDSNVSDSEQITRSTALWTLMRLDAGIDSALEAGGVSQKRLGDILRIFAEPHPDDVDDVELHDYFADTLREYLATLPDKRSVVLLADLASAIVRAGSVDSRGLLHTRLSGLSARTEVIVSALDWGISVQQSSGHVSDPPPLSGTMRSVAKELSGSTPDTPSGTREITAFEIAAAIGRRHPEYASGLLADATTFKAPRAAVKRPWSAWHDAVAKLYDREIVAGSRHEVLDGRLFLIGLGHGEAALRTAFEEQGIWGRLVAEVDETVVPTASELWPDLRPVQFAYGYQSDRPNGDDQLGIQGEVNALCEVITDHRVAPPLAVGLFGEWGSGKSFFMEKMRERVDERTDPGPARERGSDDARQRLNVVQIRFNAWHYADTSLWASLAIEIFERLADPEPVRHDDRDEWLRDLGDPGKGDRQKLLTQLETYREAKAELDAERARLRTERAATIKRRKQATRRRRAAIRAMPLTDVAGALADDAEVRAAIAGVARELGLTPAVDELVGLGTELRTSAGYVPAVWRLVKGKTWAVGLVAAFLVLILATTALILRGGWGELESLATGVGTVGAAVITMVGFVRPAVARVNRALAEVESAIKVASGKAAALRAQRSREERRLDLALAETDREIDEATRAVAALDEKIASTAATAAALTVGRRLYDFLADRAAGYQKHQGVVGMLYRDFRFLDAQLRASRAGSDETGPLPRIDRVILYIDDLDRCPPAKVLEVLEAVHLLLALELFVVVVGVDPRWLRRSLRHQYRDLGDGVDARTDEYLQDMPIEYLEKIFQIPLTLPAMVPSAYARLISSLALPTAARARARVESEAESVTRRVVPSNESPEGEGASMRAPLEVQPGSSASGDIGRPIDLTRTEIEFAQRLGPLVASPRAAKRLMNTYRLIRATQHVDSRSRFLGTNDHPGEYQAVLTLLAVAAGHPAMAHRLRVALQKDATRLGIETWPDFVRELGSTGGDGPAGRLVPADLAGASADTVARRERAAWTAMQRALTATADLIPGGLSDLEPYQRWGHIVARFSFTL